MRAQPGSRRGEHPPCRRLRETICDKTREIDRLNKEEDELEPVVAKQRAQLQDLGWGARQLEALSRMPDTGAALTEIELNRRLNHARRAFNSVLKRLGRNPWVIVDLTIESVRQGANAELRLLRAREAEIAADYRNGKQRLRAIAQERQDAERLLADAGRRGEQEGCDPRYIQQWCGA
jgi:hypothetical protein